jgi:transposase
MKPTRTSYPSDVSDEEWDLLQPYLTLMREDAPQREYSLRSLFNAMRYVAKTGCHWRYLPNDLPPWTAVYQQARRWMAAGVFEALVHDLRECIRHALHDRDPQPTAAVLDARTLQSTPESGARAGYDGAKKRKGSKVHIAVDTLGHLLALAVTSAKEQDRDQVRQLAADMQAATGEAVEVAYVDQGYTGESAEVQAAAEGVRLIVVKLPQAKRGFVLMPRRWVVERSFAWMARFRRLARDYERLSETLAGWHWLCFLTLMLRQFTTQSA